MKWIAPALAYLAVGLGLFQFHSAWGALVGFHIAIIISLLIARPKLPFSILVKSTNLKWIVLNILVCGSSGISLYFLWDKFGFANDLPAQVKALGLKSSTCSLSLPTLRWSIRSWKNTSGVGIWEAK